MLRSKGFAVFIIFLEWRDDSRGNQRHIRMKDHPANNEYAGASVTALRDEMSFTWRDAPWNRSPGIVSAVTYWALEPEIRSRLA